MKPFHSLLADARRHRGLALIIVLSMLALATIVILAFLSIADTEHKATITYSSSQTSRRLADTAVNLVVSQIRAGSQRQVNTEPVIHATQPGAVRKYNAAGIFIGGYKLFSDKDMVFLAPVASADNPNQYEEQFVTQSEPPANWNAGNNIARYVDINEPVVKGVLDAAGNATQTQVYFPVVDPRAAQDIDPGVGDDVPVEGFSYSETTAISNNNLAQASDANPQQRPIVLPGAAGGNLNELRLAMPVQWLYLLKDGAVGYLDDGLRFNVLNGSSGGLGGGVTSTLQDTYGVPSETNPMVGRIAFWTDDESCKININTASEPTYTGQPLFYHERDQSWADFPPARAEYQRFPGHPATVALSSVLYPNPLLTDQRSLDTYGPLGRISGAALANALAVKEKIYDLIPRIHTGGSVGGTRAFQQDDFRALSGDSTNSTAVAIQQAIGERLYASVDELIFDQEVSGNQRVLNNAQAGNVNLFTRDSLARASAFLTAHSRASEINMYGLPRIAMWPIDESADRRTGFDNLIGFCSRIGPPGNTYYFTRAHARTIPGGGNINGARYDSDLARNKQLLNMLDKLLNRPFPSATRSGAPSRSYVQKHGERNVRQMIIQFFDYIRTTNLYDSYLVPQNRSEWPSAPINWSNPDTGLYSVRDSNRNNWRTYTDGVVRDSNGANINRPWADKFLPGHGQVTPAEWTVGGTTYRGFGRFVSISEIGLQFICTADGKPDMYSWRTPTKVALNNDRDDRYEIPLSAADGVDPKNVYQDDDWIESLTAAAQPMNPNDYPTEAERDVAITVHGGKSALRLSEDAEFNNSYKVDERESSFDVVHDAVNLMDHEQRCRITNIGLAQWGQGILDNGNPYLVSLKRRFYSNFPPLSSDAVGNLLYNTVPSDKFHINLSGRAKNKMRWERYHPGHDSANWNYTLPIDTPLQPDEKRIQAMLHLEFFCPSVGYSQIVPDMTIVLDGNAVSNIEVDGASGALFSTTGDIVLKTEKPLYEPDATPEVGGFASFRKIAVGRKAKGFLGAGAQIPADLSYNENAVGRVHDGLLNLDLISNFVTVKRDQPLQFRGGGSIRIDIYDTHDYQRAQPVQTIFFNLQAGRAPAPDLVSVGTYRVNYTASDGSIYNHPPVQAPRWWGFHADGVLGRVGGALAEGGRASLRGRLNRDYPGEGVNSETRAHYRGVDAGANGAVPQSMPGARALIYGKDSGNYLGVRLVPSTTPNALVQRMKYGPNPADSLSSWDRPWHFGSDSLRTLQPAHGDARIIAAKKTVAASEWTPHRLWSDENEFIAHNFSSYTAGGEPGFDYGNSNTNPDVNMSVRPLPPAVSMVGSDNKYVPGRHPDAPHGRSSFARTPLAAHEYIQRYYDFDDSDPGGRIGPFINKPDEGNYSIGEYTRTGWPGPKVWRGTYFRSDGITERFAAGSGSFFTPNRMISSPVMFGSLPSRVWDDNGSGAWTNLLFRPHVSIPNGITGGVPSAAVHPGEETPPDHYLLDLFWMPVVEPYAISEPLSTAGKINMNYQMLPFTHIRRATALHAVMKGEVFAALPNSQYELSKVVRNGWGVNGSTAPVMRSESNSNAYWHRTIAIDRFKPLGGSDSRWWEIAVGQRVQGTLLQFEERFNFGKSVGATELPAGMRGGLFRSASQICEIHLIPNPLPGGATANVTPASVASVNGRDDAMGSFWAAHCATGDNTRERPYSNLYARLTTRSNTFRVHVRAQSIRKSLRSVDPALFDPNRDLMSGEFRGSFLLERYIDQGDLGSAGAQIDFAAAANPFALDPLENYYRFRILESKRFAP